jgi:uncharacterized protein (DUF2236 family)
MTHDDTSSGASATTRGSAAADVSMIPLDPVRRFVGERVRRAVVGSDPDRRHAELFESDGPRWFADDSPVRTVHADSAMFVGGLRALLLQSLHPLAMAGVAQHSDYRHDPWGRLQRTADFMAATTFGPVSEAERAVAIVRSVHERVTGVASDGRPYAANDPHLLRWVHVAEIDSFLAAYRRHGAGRLTDDEADRYVREMAVVARALGVPAPPESVASLRDQIRGYRPELRSTPEARDAARYLLLRPPMHPAMRPAYTVLASAAVALLPRWARWPLRLPYLPVTETLAVRPAGDALVRGLRWAMTPTR